MYSHQQTKMREFNEKFKYHRLKRVVMTPFTYSSKSKTKNGQKLVNFEMENNLKILKNFKTESVPGLYRTEKQKMK